jgi:pilus assembly protein CpaC
MRKFFAIFVVAISFCSGAVAATQNVLEVGVNRAELINLGKPMAEVMVASPDIADIVVHGQNKISVIGKKLGNTNIRFFDRNNNLIDEVDVVVGYDLPNIRRSLKNFFPDLKLSVSTINNSIAVAGIVPDAQTANRVMQVVYEFVKENRRDDNSANAALSQGNVAETDNRFPGVVNLLSLNSSQQVMLKVRIGELQRTALKKLGFNLQSETLSSGGSFQFGTGSGTNIFAPTGGGFGKYLASSTLPSANPFAQVGATLTNGAFKLGTMLDLLEQDGLFKLMAEPTLTTVSGENANFLAGGEFPIIIQGGTGESDNVEYKQYGVSLNFVPFVLSQNRVRIVVQPELSEIDTTRSTDTPSLKTRKAKTTVELAPGESFMIAGLIRDQINSAIQEVPGIAELPIISSLARSTSYTREETELVIAVTPYIVDPVVGSDIRLPTDNLKTPSTMEMFFYGALGSMTGNAYRQSQKPLLEGPVGFMTD